MLRRLVHYLHPGWPFCSALRFCKALFNAEQHEGTFELSLDIFCNWPISYVLVLEISDLFELQPMEMVDKINMKEGIVIFMA
jgi:hypothetical protein